MDRTGCNSPALEMATTVNCASIMTIDSSNTTAVQPVALTLASASPRRASLLRDAGYEVTIVPPPHEEPQRRPAQVAPAQWAEALSYYKARSVACGCTSGLVLGGDTVAAIGNEIFGKPRDRHQAREILGRLCEAPHDVITGLTLIDAATGARVIRHDTTTVHMRPMTEAELEAYLDSEAWIGKAGAYGIQDHGDQFVERIDGSFSNVVGLPIELLSSMLEEFRRHGDV